MKNLILIVMVVVSFLSCGSSVKKTVNQEEQEELISENNFINMAKYHYQRELSELEKNADVENNNNKFRSYPGSKNSQSSVTDTIKVIYVTPFDKYIESMSISYKDRLIDLKVKNNLFAEVSLYINKNLIKSEKLTMNQFSSYDLPKVKGEVQ